MADTVVTLRPNGTPSSGNWVNAGGAGSFHAATNDNSDSTSAQPSDGTYLFLAFDDPTIPALAVVHSVRVRVRANGGAGQTGVASLKNNGTGATYSVSGTYGGSGSQATYTLGSDTTHFLTGATLNNLQVFLQAAPGCTVAEVYVDVFYNQAPAVTTTAPTGTITTTLKPTVTWTYSDPESDAQERYQVKIFDSATYGGGGFDPATSTPAWDSGIVFSSATSTVPSSPLDNSTTYKAYVKAADVGSAGRFGAWAAGPAFTTAITAPTAPGGTVTAQNSNGRIQLVFTGTDASGTGGEIQRSIDGGATWQAVDASRFFLGTPLASWDGAVAGTTPVTVYDYEAPPAVVTSYRGRVFKVVSGEDIYSAWSGTPTATFAPLDSWLKAPLNPNINMAIDLQLPLKTERRERQATFYPLGRSRPIVLADALLGEEGTAIIETVGQSEYAALEALRATRTVVLLQTPDGNNWYVRIGEVRSTEREPGTAVYRMVQLPFAEVDAP